MVRIAVLALLFIAAHVAASHGADRILYFGTGVHVDGFLVDETRPASQHVLGFRIDGQTYYAALDREEPFGPLTGEPTIRVKNSMGHRFSMRVIEPLPDTPPIYEPPIASACIGDATVLQPGTYLLVVRGGRGGNGGGTAAQGAADGFDAIERRFRVTLDTPKVAYIFRGGNGNPGSPGITSGNARSAAGGGSSGAPSAIILCDPGPTCIDGEIFISEGGAGGRGAGAGNNQGNLLYGRGAGGGFGPFRNGEDGFVDVSQDFSVGGGGGAAPGGYGGAEFVAIAGSWFAEAGENATDLISGRGGRGCGLRPNGLLHCSPVAGAGASTISWTCGGHTLHSYGGGSGGGLAFRNQIVSGGSGGAGAGTQTTHSFARIYRLD